MTPETTILVLNRLAERHMALIHNALPDAKIISSELADAAQYIADATILVAWGHMDLQALIAQAPNLKWVHALSAGVEKLTGPVFANDNLILTNSRGIHGIPVSEHVFSMILAFSRGLNLFIRQQEQKQWHRVPTDEIYEKTIGIIGLGSIGREIAKRAKALGMTVMATKHELSEEIFVDKLYPADQLLDMLPACDFVVATLPLTPENEGLLDLKHFSAMKPSAYFINISRGAVVREDELVQALQTGLIRGAGLDVFMQEPLPADSPLWQMPNVILTPHIAAISPIYLDRAVKLFCDNLLRFSQDREMLNVVDRKKGY